MIYKSLFKRQKVSLHSNRTLWKRYNKHILLQIIFYLLTIAHALIEFLNPNIYTVQRFEMSTCPRTKLIIVLFKKSLINLLLSVLILIVYFILIPSFMIIYIQNRETMTLSKKSLKKNRSLIKMTLRLIIYASVTVSVWLIFSIGWLIAFARFPNLNLNSFEKINDPFKKSKLLKTIDFILFYIDPFIIISINKIIRNGLLCRANRYII